MHTIVVVAGGFLLLGLCLSIGRWTGAGLRKGALWFVPLWLIAAAVNMWVGVSQAGYTAAQEFPIFLAVFAIPAAAAGLLWWWKLPRD